MSFLLDRLSKKDRGDILHSSVYGKTQNQEGFGTTSTSVFEERIKVDQNRKTIRNYRDAQVVNDASISALKYSAKERLKGEEESIQKAGVGDNKQQVDKRQMNDGLQKKDFSIQRRQQMKNESLGMRQNTMRDTSGMRKAAPPARKNPGIFR